MIMESPVRICLGAALVVNLLLLSGTVSGNALPLETTPSLRDEKVLRPLRTNTTLSRRHKTPDVASNELQSKEPNSEEPIVKDAKYKDRGRTRFSKSTSTTPGPYRRVRSTTSKTTSTEATKAKLIIVTPTPEMKNTAQIIDSMRKFKRTKMPVSLSSTTSLPPSVKSVLESEEEEYENEEHEEDKENSKKYLSSKYDSTFFTIPSYNDDIGHDSEGLDNKVKFEYSSSPFSSYFSDSFGPKEYKNDDPFKSNNYFDVELTTPRNAFFDKKHQAITQDIIRNLERIKAKSPTNSTNIKIVEESRPLEKLKNGTGTNKSTIVFKNTKEIRISDNDEAGSNNNKELSDVQGTSVYYQRTVLSTETYNIDHSSDDDCDNDTLPNEPTASTSEEEEFASLKATEATFLPSTKSYPDPPLESVSTLSSSFLPYSTIGSPIFNAVSPVSFSTYSSSISSTSSVNNFSRNRGYSKRLSPTEDNGSANNVTPKVTDSFLNRNSNRQPTRKFHHTTPKVKPIWMHRNSSRYSYTRSTLPTTLFYENFDIRNRLSTPTPKPLQSQNSSLTTVSSEIDPVLQTEISGVKKIVHSQATSDNSIPTLWKRGSTKYSTATTVSSESEGGTSDMEIPPTLTAWALASLRSPPSMASYLNASSTQKSADENELQKVEVTEKIEPSSSPATTTAISHLNNDIISDKDQTVLPWKPVIPLISQKTTIQSSEETVNVSKSERLPAESNISFQSSAQSASIERNKADTTETFTENSSEWVSAAVEQQTTTEVTKIEKTIHPVDATKSTGFESITKLPSDLTTPHDDTFVNEQSKESEIPTTTDFEITTIRFSYGPKDATERSQIEHSTNRSNTSAWHPVFPTRTRTTTIKDGPITTYRPKYATTTENVEETTIIPEMTTYPVEASSQKLEKVTDKVPENVTEIRTETSSSKVITTTTPMQNPTETTEAVETTTMIVKVQTEINTERQKISTEPLSTESSSTETETAPSEIRESSSEENSNSNEVITQEPKSSSPTTTIKITTTTEKITTTQDKTETEVVTEAKTTTQDAKIVETTVKEKSTEEVSTEETTKSINDLEDLTSFNGEVTTEASTRVLNEDPGSGAAVAIAVSTIGVIALILLVGLLLIVRRRGRRGVYAQRCTPVSLDAYSLDSVSVGHRKGNHRLRASKRSYGNPAYDDEVTSHPMQYPALANFALDMESMSAEFAEIPSVSVRGDEVPPGCEDKNRYSNVLPLPETRVPLKRIGSDPATEYINANYITGPGNIRNYYIACQAPLSNTVIDFWRMVWEQNSRVVIMLTEYMENGVEKCFEYLPPSEVSDNKRTFGDYQVVLVKRDQRDKYAVSSVQLINMTTRTWREITHLWYFWPAKGVPDDYDSVLDFLSEMRSYMKTSQTAKEYDEEGVEIIYGDQNRSSFHNLSKLKNEDSSSGNGVNVYSPAKAEENLRRGNVTNGTLGRMKAASEVEGVRPCVVVCASGAGRSATVIAADVCARALAAACVDVPRVVREIRAQRPHSISNRQHYVFLYKLLSEYGNKLTGGGVDTI